MNRQDQITQAIARRALPFFIVKTNGKGESCVTLHKNRPWWVQEIARKALNDYKTIREALEYYSNAPELDRRFYKVLRALRETDDDTALDTDPPGDDDDDADDDADDRLLCPDCRATDARGRQPLEPGFYICEECGDWCDPDDE